MAVCNTTLEDATVNEQPLWGSYTFHDLGLALCASFGLFAFVLSCYLMFMHATHYLKPHEQKHIIRILFMVPIYTVVSFLSYWKYQQTIYYAAIRDCYEAFAIASFFSLMCAYVAPDLHDQKEYFRTIQPKQWVFPLSMPRSWFSRGSTGFYYTVFKKPPRSGLTWFNIVWFCIFQYCFIRVFMTIIAVISQAAGRYCSESLSPAFAHVWVVSIEGGAVSVAMFCVIQFYIQLKDDIAEHGPGLKVASIKGVIFFSFWQTIIIDLLISHSIIKPSATISMPDLMTGIPSVLLCIEMAGFAVLHLFAYPWKVYDVNRSSVVAAESVGGFDSSAQTQYVGGRFGYKAFLQAYNPWDIIKAVGRGFRWMAVGRRYREQDISYKQPNTNGTVLDDRNGLKQNGAYQKLNEPGSRDSSPHRNPAQRPTPYDAPGQAFGAAPSPYARSGGSDELMGPPAAYDPISYSDEPSRTAYGISMEDTSYHGAGGRRNLDMRKDAGDFR